MRLAARIFAPLVLLLAVLLPAGTATAAPPLIQRFHVFEGDINACNGEVIALEVHAQFITKEQTNGLTVQTLTYHATGIGNQGNRYVLNVTELFKTDADRLLVQRRELVSTGSAPNQQVLIILDFNNGDIFVESDCRG
jgi:hypothetical protein